MIRLIRELIRFNLAIHINEKISLFQSIPLIKKLVPLRLYRHDIKLLYKYVYLLFNYVIEFAYKFLLTSFVVLYISAKDGFSGNLENGIILLLFTLRFAIWILILLIPSEEDMIFCKVYKLDSTLFYKSRIIIKFFKFFTSSLIYSFVFYIFGKNFQLILYLIPIHYALLMFISRVDIELYRIKNKRCGKSVVAISIFFLIVSSVLFLLNQINIIFISNIINIYTALITGILSILIYLIPIEKRSIRRFINYTMVINKYEEVSIKNVEMSIFEEDGLSLENKKSTSNHKGMRYLHDIFFERKHKIFHRSKLIKIGTTLIIYTIISIFLILKEDFRDIFNNNFMILVSLLNCAIFWILNINENFEKNLYFSMDLFLMKNKIYRNYKNIKESFIYRAIQIQKDRSLILLFSVFFTIFVSVLSKNDNYINVIITILLNCISYIYYTSFHLIKYYIFQPYNAGNKLKSFMNYIFNNILVYLIIISFSIKINYVIIFSFIYSIFVGFLIISLFLFKKLSIKNFR